MRLLISIKLLIIPISLGVFFGCASISPKSDAYIKNFNLESKKIPSRYVIKNVPYYKQTADHCGPASLAMIMNWSGTKVSVKELTKKVFTKSMKGSFQTDMITASRREGLMAIPIKGFNSLISEISSGKPVLIFENLGVSWLPLWHYAVVYGYDLNRKKIILHTGLEKAKSIDISEFENSWKRGNYWGLLVFQPEQLSKTAGELEHMKAAAALEKFNFINKANMSYTKILSRWPKSLSAHMGLANIAFKEQRYTLAKELLIKTTQLHPKSKAAKHNLDITLKKMSE